MKLSSPPICDHESIAIIGIGCRFPGAAGPQSFWKLLCAGVDAITETPEDRWDLKAFYDPNREVAGKIYTRRGGFLQNIDRFEPKFFGISPREAAYMDPQQRLLLETTWTALEDSGYPAPKVAGEKVGVFIGLFMHDYENIHSGSIERKLFGPHSATGMSTTISANRISYVYDFKGPSLIVDTACSSSLVAVHLACRSLADGESAMAVAGGVNILIRPEMNMVLCKGSFLSPDGRCKAFDARADGYVRSEGVGIVILKRLSDALADQDDIYAVIRGTAVNQDGQNEGITVPSADAQMAVIREALRNAGKKPTEIQYVEAHGTGTAVGDPVETRALGTVFGDNRPTDQPLIIGSAKTNIGHTESAAGVAGLIKAALMLRNGYIPPNLHFDTPNPNIPFGEWKLRVPTKLESWPGSIEGKPLCVGVNSFGFGGTNAHAILERSEPVADSSSASTVERMAAIPLSAHSPDSLKAMAQSFREYLSSDDAIAISPADIGRTTALHREHHDCRLSISARSLPELVEGLDSYLSGEQRSGVVIGKADQKAPSKLAFIFSGMGQQWPCMGRRLYETEPVFRAAMDECSVILGKYTNEWSLIEEIFAEDAKSHLDETRIAQPAIVAIGIALTALWRSWGIRPDVVLGHSVGEIAACHAAGILTLEDTLRLAYYRSFFQHRLTGAGSMLAVGLPLQEADMLLNGHRKYVSVAAINGPSNVTLSGKTEVLQQIASHCESDRIFARFLNVTVPFHSVFMDSILDESAKCLADIIPQPSHTAMVSTVAGKLIDWKEINVSYWLRNMRDPVLFASGFSELLNSGCDAFIEISAHPVLATPMQDCIAGYGGGKKTVIPSLRRSEPDDVMAYDSLGQLFAAGYPINWECVFENRGKFVRLPAYQWRGERYWTESEESMQTRLNGHTPGGSGLIGQKVHPLLGGHLNSAKTTWNSDIDLHELSYLRDHVVQGNIIYPAAAYLETALASAKELYGPGSYSIHEVEIKAPLILKEEGTTVQTTIDPDGTFSVYSKVPGDQKNWSLHVQGSLVRTTDQSEPPAADMAALQTRCSKLLTAEEHYLACRLRGLDYGACFRAVESVSRNSNEALGRIRIPGVLADSLENYLLHPVILDACLQTMGSIEPNGAYLPVGMKQVRLYRRPGADLWCHARLARRGENSIRGDLILYNSDGEPVAEVRGLICRLVHDEQGFRPDSISKLLYSYAWLPDSRKTIYPDACFLTSPRKIAGRMKKEIAESIERLDRRGYYETISPEMNRLCSSYILQALANYGVQGEMLSLGEYAERIGVIPEHQRLLKRLLEILVEDGPATKNGEKWGIVKEGEDDCDAAWRRLALNHPSYHAELVLLGRCGSQLREVLRGETDPLSLIFSQNSTAAEHFYQHSPTYRMYNSLMQSAVGKALDHMPEDRILRVLEIGAGTGAMTAHLLPLLPAHRTKYVFSDITAAFTVQAEQKFSNYSFVEYQSLDIEKDPLAQGFAPHSFDLIIAADVLHATSVLANTVANIKTLLVADGMLALLETTNPPRWFDLTFGMLKGWWLFSDTNLRPNHPLLGQKDWLSLLSSSGFSNAVCLPDREGECEPLHSVLLAQGPAVENGAHPETTFSLPSESSAPWIILSGKNALAEQIAGLLKNSGINPVIISNGAGFDMSNDGRVTVNPDCQEGIHAMLDALCPDATAPAIINLWGIENSADGMTAESLNRFMNASCRWTLHLAQALIKRPWTGMPRMWLITAGSQTAGGHAALALASTPLWGFGRVMMTELAGIETRMIDLDPDPSERNLAALLEELLSPDAEDEIALRGGGRFLHRLVRDNETDAPSVPTQPYVLKYSKGFDGFEFAETTPRKPGPDEIEISVKAAGVNFKDMAKISGLLNEAALERSGLPPHLGVECAGVVTSVGKAAPGFTEGDEVMGIVLDCFASHVTSAPHILVRKPSNISFEEAATIPVAFLTAWYALHELGRIRKGDRVLIHTAAGSVGLAAIQIARAAGAEIAATAGSLEKREYLERLGISCVADSRSPSFASDIENVIGSAKIDIVLNTLPPSTIPLSMSLLKPHSGRFIDISNLYERTLSIPAPEKGVSFHSFTLERMIIDNPAYVRSMLEEIVRKFESGELHPLPHRVFPIAEISGAFRAIRKGTGIGKVVLSMQAPLALIPDISNISVSRNATYLITGGLGGFGLATARWLADCGAKHLVLCGRSGASTPIAQETAISLRNDGVQVAVEQVDVTEEKQVAAMLDRINASMPPLRGIIHGAMVLDDVPIMNMQDEQLEKVLGPKAMGAWNLHTLTLGKDLDFFICFSSFAVMVGNSDQANYVAANLFLDSLAHYRAAQGLPALSINWGPLSEAGYVAQHGELREHFYHQGIGEVSFVQAWKTIAAGLSRNKKQIGVSPANWRKFSKYSLSVGRSPVYSLLVKSHKSDNEETARAILSLDAASSPEEQLRMIEESMVREVSKIMGIPPDQLDKNQSLDQLGFDSLLAVELVVAIESLTGLSLPKMTLLQPGLTIAEIVDIIFKQRAGNNKNEIIKIAANLDSSEEVETGDSQINVDAMSDEEVDSLLTSLLLNEHSTG